MKKILFVICLLFAGSFAFGQSLVFPDGVVFQRRGVGQGAILDIAINFNDANLSNVQVYVEKYNENSNSTVLFKNWENYTCDSYPGVGGVFRRVILILPDGNYKMRVRRPDNLQSTDTRRVGVGEVLYVAGQSNTTGVETVAVPDILYPTLPLSEWIRFENSKDDSNVQLNSSQVQTNCPIITIPNPNEPNSEYNKIFKVGFDDSDPSKSYVSHWYRLAEKLVYTLKVPVAVYQTGWAGTSIEDWSTGANGNKVCRLFQNSVSNITTYPYFNLKTLFSERKFNGVRAVLWHQGEFDGLLNTLYQPYKVNLENLIAKSRIDSKAAMGVTINLPWVISQASVSNGVGTKSNITSAQYDVAQQSNNWLGPNTDLIGNRFDNTHFNKDGLTALADEWYNKLIGGIISSSVPIPAFGKTISNPCTSLPQAPTISASSTIVCGTETVTLTASTCVGGSINWENGGPNVGAGTYTATCVVGGCKSNPSNQVTITNSGPCGGGCPTCPELSPVNSGNPSEFREYNVCVPTAGYYDIKLTYTTGESPTGTMKINTGAIQSFSLPNRNSWSNFTEITVLSNIYLNANNNTIKVASGGGTFVHKKVCAVSGGGCGTLPMPQLSASANSVCTTGTVTLNATNCAGIVNWPNGSSNVGPGTYVVTCTVSGCNSPVSNSITIIDSGPCGGGCPICPELSPVNSGNPSEFREYSVCVPTAGYYDIKLTYTTGESPTGTMKINTGAIQSFSLPNRNSWSNFTEITVLSNIYLNANNNTIKVASGGGTFVHKKVCAVCINCRVAAIESNSQSTQTTLQPDDVTLSPNPNNGIFKVNVVSNAEKEVELLISNKSGKVLTTRKVKLSEGSNTFDFKISEMEGLYILNVIDGNVRFKKQIAKIEE